MKTYISFILVIITLSSCVTGDRDSVSHIENSEYMDSIINGVNSKIKFRDVIMKDGVQRLGYYDSLNHPVLDHYFYKDKKLIKKINYINWNLGIVSLLETKYLDYQFCSLNSSDYFGYANSIIRYDMTGAIDSTNSVFIGYEIIDDSTILINSNIPGFRDEDVWIHTIIEEEDSYIKRSANSTSMLIKVLYPEKLDLGLSEIFCVVTKKNDSAIECVYLKPVNVMTLGSVPEMWTE